MGIKVKANRHGFLAFRLYWNNLESWEGTGLRDTPANRKLLEAQAVLINHEIDKGTFDYLKWFPNGNRANLFQQQEKKTSPQTIEQYYDTWIADKIPPLVKKSRSRKYISHFNAHIIGIHGERYLHLYDVEQIREIRAELIHNRKLSIKTAKNVINATLRAFFRDATAQKLIEKSPFDELPKNWWPKTLSPPIDPFTEAERDEILKYFFAKYWGKWPHGCVFLYTLFWHGMRPSELTGRRWSELNLRTGNLSIPTSRTEGEEGNHQNRREQPHRNAI
jgi:integrase